MLQNVSGEGWSSARLTNVFIPNAHSEVQNDKVGIVWFTQLLQTMMESIIEHRIDYMGVESREARTAARNL